MKSSQTRLLAGLLLIVSGAVFLLQNLNLISLAGFGEFVLAAFFGLGALAFLAIYISNREHWWALIPGSALAGIAGILFLEWLSPALENAIGGPLFLGTMALGFLLIYITDRQHWWAIMPGGIMLTLAAVAGLDFLLGGDAGAVVFFLGLAATFGLVAIVPTEHGPQRWALIPAGVTLVLALITAASAFAIVDTIWPLALILFGAYLLLRQRGVSMAGASPNKEELK